MLFVEEGWTGILIDNIIGQAYTVLGIQGSGYRQV